MDAGLYVSLHALAEGMLAVKKGVQNLERTGVSPKRLAQPGVQVKEADQIVVGGQGLNQAVVPPLGLQPGLLLPLLLGGAVQQKTLVEQLAALPDQLDVAHDVEEVAVGVLNPVLHIDAVLLLTQGEDGVPQLWLVLIQNSGGDQIESVFHHFRLGPVTQNLQGGPVDAEDAGPVQTVAHDAAVHGGEEGFQGLGLGNQLLFIGPLLSDVDGGAHGAHDAAI